MKLRSFKMRILVWTWALLLGVLAVVFYYSTSVVSSELVKETERRSLRELETVRWLIEDRAPFASEKAFAEWVDAFGFKAGSRITYIHEGRVVADSEVPFQTSRRLMTTLPGPKSLPPMLTAAGRTFGIRTPLARTCSMPRSRWTMNVFPAFRAVS